MAHIPFFHNPFGFQMQQNIAFPQHFVVPQMMQPQILPLQFGGIPVAAVSIQKTVEAVGCVILTKSKTPHQYDLLLCHSERKAYEVFGGDIVPNSSPRECMNSLLGKIGLHAPHSTPFIDVENSMNGKIYRIYVLYIPHISATLLTNSIKMNPVISHAFHHFIRFPVTNIAGHHMIRDDKNIPRELTTFSRNILFKIANSYRNYLS